MRHNIVMARKPLSTHPICSIVICSIVSFSFFLYQHSGCSNILDDTQDSILVKYYPVNKGWFDRNAEQSVAELNKTKQNENNCSYSTRKTCSLRFMQVYSEKCGYFPGHGHWIVAQLGYPMAQYQAPMCNLPQMDTAAQSAPVPTKESCAQNCDYW